MTDEVTAQKILQNWASSRGFSTTLTVDPGQNRLFFHFDKYNGFAFLDFSKSPRLKLIVSTNPEMGANRASNFWGGYESFDLRQKLADEYDLNLADEKVFLQIERILDRTITSYTEG